MTRIKVLFKISCLAVLLLSFAEHQVFAGKAKIIFGGLNPGKKFVPADTTISVGDTIEWNGAFGAADPFHQLMSISVPQGAQSFGPVTTGTTFQYVVTVPGTYNYICANHCCGTLGNMQGSFTVAAAGVKANGDNGDISLEKNFPNPFTVTTTIRYSLKKASQVSLKIFDVNGKEIKTLINVYQGSGSYAIPFDGSSLSSGTYVYRLQAGEAVLTKEMIITR